MFSEILKSGKLPLSLIDKQRKAAFYGSTLNRKLQAILKIQ